MKRIVSFLLTLSLLLSIAPFAFATETSELTEVTYLPIALEYDSDLVVTEGQELDSNTFMGGEKARNFVNAGKYLGPAASEELEFIVGTDESGNPIIEKRPIRVPAADTYNTVFNPYNAKTSSIESSLNKAFTDAELAIAFDIPEGGEASKVNDTIIRYGLQEAKIVETSGRPSSKIYFAHAASGKADLEVIFEYTDGTFSDIKTLESANYANFDDVSNYFTRDGYLKNNQSAYKMADDGTAQKIHRYVVEAEELPLADGSGTKKPVKKNEDGTYATEVYSALQTFVGISSIDVDANKVVKNIYIGSSFDNVIAIYAATEATLTNDELVAATTKTATDDELKYAKACVDELVNYRGADAADYKDIITASNNKNFNLKNDPAYYLDLPADSDSIAVEGDILNSDWRTMRTKGGGLNAKNPYIYLPGTVKAVDGTPVKIIVAESGEPDSIARYKSGAELRDCEKEVKVIPSKGRPASKLNIAYASNGDKSTKLVWTIKYTDGTSEDVTVSHISYTRITDATKYATYYLGGSGISSTDGVATLIKDGDNTKNASLVVTSIDLAPGKIVESYTIAKNVAGYNMVVYGLSETPRTNDELLAVVNQDFSEATSEQLEYAMACAEELVNNRGADRSVCQNVYIAYNEVEFIKPVHLDISNQLNTDIIVNHGDIIAKESFTGSRYQKLYNSSKIPEGGFIGMISKVTEDTFTKNDGTVLSSAYFGEVLSDATFQLADGYKGFGNDAVLVPQEEEDGVTIQLSNEEQKPYSKLYFLLYSPTGEVPYLEPYTVDVKINYEDGSMVEGETYLHDSAPYFAVNSAKYAPGAFFANLNMQYGMLDLYEEKDAEGNDILRVDYGIKASTGNISDEAYDKARFTASTLNPIRNEVGENEYEFTYPKLNYKKVKSITFMPSAETEYSVLAVTALPYTSPELEAMWELAMEEYDYDPENIVVGIGGNDSTIEEGAKALIELYSVRGYVDLWEDVELAQEMLAEVNSARQFDDSNFETKLSFIKEGGKIKAKALVTNINAAIPSKNIVLIIAVYGQNNKLLDIQASSLTPFVNGDIDKELVTPECDDHEGEAVSYSAFVWESLDSMRPINSYTESAQQ